MCFDRSLTNTYIYTHTNIIYYFPINFRLIYVVLPKELLPSFTQIPSLVSSKVEVDVTKETNFGVSLLLRTFFVLNR